MLSAERSVEAMNEDDNSILKVYKRFSKARNQNIALAHGELSEVASSTYSIALWTMTYEGQTVLVAHNFGNSEASVTVSGYKLGKPLVSNGTVSANGSELILGEYSSAVFEQ